MKKSYTFILAIFVIAITYACTQKKASESAQNLSNVADTNDATNDFYDNENTHFLPLEKIIVDGETNGQIEIDLTNLPLHSVIVKETAWTADSNKFIGAYRYNGSSLYDILNQVPLLKKNAEQFNPIIDAYVEIRNNSGEKVVFSWGEIFYPIHRHEIIIATQVMQIVPSKTKEYWALPNDARIVAAADLITERNISNPAKITIRSLDKQFEVIRELDPMFSESVGIFNNEKEVARISEMPEGPMVNYPNIFYGRGRGIHAVTPFTGTLLNSQLIEYFTLNREALRTGMFTISAADGYRAAFTYSELMNRNDQSEVLLIDKGDSDGGRFIIYPSADFFSDRAIKSINGIWYNEL
ncbi:MAG: hypothetical protein V2I62_11430 [Bacteroidales bacterium]|jgi:hypothetical protein|nr:hypothetical protein [Bacteroidales bacterium]